MLPNSVKLNFTRAGRFSQSIIIKIKHGFEVSLINLILIDLDSEPVQPSQPDDSSCIHGNDAYLNDDRAVEFDKGVHLFWDLN